MIIRLSLRVATLFSPEQVKQFLIFYRLFKESVIFAFQALIVNKLRTFLSLLGVTIGIFSIISVFTLVDSLRAGIDSSFDVLNDDVIYIQQMPWGPEEGDSEFAWWEYIKRRQPSLRDAEKLESRLTKARAVAFATGNSATAEYKSSTYENADIAGVSHDYKDVLKLDIASGRYFTLPESEGGRAVCLIGSEVAETLFGNLNPIGKDVKVQGLKMRVIGVFGKEGTSVFGSPFDRLVLTPIKYGTKLINIKNTDCQILVRAKPNVPLEELKAEVLGHFRSVRRLGIKQKNDFSVNEASMITAIVDVIFSTVNLVGWVIGFFALIVGGFSIANIMFVSVKERTNIIGIQKALGAKNSFIMLQFLAESVTLCVIGGIMGLLTMSFMVWIANMAIDGLELQVFLSNVVIGISIAAIIGLLAGIIPAYLASRLNPVDAIRSK